MTTQYELALSEPISRESKQSRCGKPHPQLSTRRSRGSRPVHHAPGAPTLDPNLFPPLPVSDGVVLAANDGSPTGAVPAGPQTRSPALLRRTADRPSNDNDDRQTGARFKLHSWSQQELRDYIHILEGWSSPPPIEDRIYLVVARWLLEEARERERASRSRAVLARVRPVGVVSEDHLCSFLD